MPNGSVTATPAGKMPAPWLTAACCPTGHTLHSYSLLVQHLGPLQHPSLLTSPAVSGEHPGNRLLEKRGNALTHDLELGTATLRALSSAAGSDARTRVPRYDKSAHAGRGDRFPEDQWAAVEGPVDLVLFEGWMLGFQATDEEAAAAIDPDLVPINRALRRWRIFLFGGGGWAIGHGHRGCGELNGTHSRAAAQ